MTQNNLGDALWALGERESGTARLEEAVGAYRAALEERTRERVPLDWAVTQNNLGNALSRSGSGRAGRRGWRRRSPPTARRWRSGPASGCRSTGRGRRTTWAPRSATLGERESGTARLEEAVGAYRAALEVFEATGTGRYADYARRGLERAEKLVVERRRVSDS